MRQSHLLAGAALLVLAGCTRNTVVLIFQGRHPPVDLACALGPLGGLDAPSARSPNRSGVPVDPAQELIAPRHAAPDAVSGGCAGVLFRLGPDGRPIDLRVVVESPRGFGFGEVALKAIAATHFKPNPNDAGWHYVTVTEHLPTPSPGAHADDSQVHT